MLLRTQMGTHHTRQPTALLVFFLFIVSLVLSLPLSRSIDIFIALMLSAADLIGGWLPVDACTMPTRWTTMAHTACVRIDGLVET